MSETTQSSQTSAGMESAQGTAAQPKKSQTGAQPKPKAGVPAQASSRTGRSAGGEGSDDIHSPEGKEPEGSDGSARKEWNLPEDFDLDAADEDTLKRLEKWKKKIKVNGKEQVVSLSDALRYMQKDLATQQSLQPLSQKAQQLDAILHALKSDPTGLMERMGLNVDEIAKQRVAQHLRLQAMSEEQRAAYQASQERDQYKQLAQKLYQQELQRKQQADMQAARKQIEGEFVDAFQKAGIKINHPLALTSAVQFLRAEKANNPDATAHDIMPKVKNYLQSLSKVNVSSLSAAELVDFLGAEKVNALREHLVSQATGQPVRTGVVAERPTSKQSKAMTADEYREMIDKQFG